MNSPATLILGWDGATPDLLFPWVEQGHLPNLKGLLDTASFGTLQSVQPPMTLPAWASFLCGVGPGEHGIFDFASVDPPGRLRFVDARDRACPTLLEQASIRGLKVGCFLFPSTWPPGPLSGGQISGFDSPVSTRVRKEACSPPSLHREIGALLGHDLAYADLCELRKGPGWEEEALDSLLRGIADKERLALHLLGKGQAYDIFALLFGESDTVSHHFWHAMDRSSPRFDSGLHGRVGDAVLSVYRRLDEALGRILSAPKSGWDRVVIASDHGFGPASDRVLHLNAFLERAGFCRFRRRTVAPSFRSLRQGLASSLPHQVLDRLSASIPPAVTERIESQARFGALDLDKSLAYSEELNYAPSIRLLPGSGAGVSASNGRSERLEALSRALLAWRDPFSGSPVLAAIHPRERLHPGPLTSRAPDWYLEPNLVDGATYCFLPSKSGDPPVRRLRSEELQGVKGGAMAGSHRRNGIFVFWGQGARPGWQHERIERLLPRIFAEDLWASAEDQLVLNATDAPSVRGRHAARPAALARRLRSLGYLP